MCKDVRQEADELKRIYKEKYREVMNGTAK
jgi:hypothetical protein